MQEHVSLVAIEMQVWPPVAGLHGSGQREFIGRATNVTEF